MKREIIKYQLDDISFDGYACYDESHQKKRPGVLVAHAWMGQDHFAKEKAEELAKLGYVGFAADLYGDGISLTTSEEATQYMAPLFQERKKLRARISAAYETLKKHPMVDPERIAAIGFCFGGLTVIELLRSGAELLATVPFHGLMGTKFGKIQANIEPNASKLYGSFLALHGYKDPLVSQEDIAMFQKELTESGLDWQFYVYGNAYHAFTNPEADDLSHGLLYDPITARRSWNAMKALFQEVL